MQWARQFLSDVSLAPRLVAVPPSISNIRCRENSKQNHKASCSKSGKSNNATENANAKNNGTENAKKMQLPTLHFLRCIFFATCDVAFSPLLFFCNFDQLLYFFYEKKTKKCKQKCNGTKTNATENAKKCNFQRCIFWVAFFLQLATSHFLSWFFSFSKLATLRFLICLYLEGSSNKQHI